MITPKEYVGSIMELAQQRRGEYVDMQVGPAPRSALPAEDRLLVPLRAWEPTSHPASGGNATGRHLVSGRCTPLAP